MRRSSHKKLERWRAGAGRARSHEAGDTLIELLVALTIISICAVGLIGGLASAISSSGNHRNLTSLDAAIKNFADLVRYEVQLQPASVTGTPLFARCAAKYLIAGAPTPSSGPVGTAVTAFGTGFGGTGQGSVSIDGTTSVPNSVTPANGTYGNVTANFTIPAMPAGTHTITLNNGGTATAPTGFTVTPWLGALSPASGPPNTLVTVPVTGFEANAPLQVKVGTAAPVPGVPTNKNGSSPPGLPVSFRIPNGLPNGPQTVVISDGTNSAQAIFTVGGTGPGLPGLANPIVSTSPLTGYQVGVSGINFWSGTSFPQPAESPTQCQNEPSSPNQDIQQITVSGSAPGAGDELNTVVTNPQYVPTPTMTTTLDASRSTVSIGGQLVFDATEAGPIGGPAPSGNVIWQINTSGPGAAPTCASTTVLTQNLPPNGSSATATCTISGPGLIATTYFVRAVYNGDSQYNSAAETFSPVTVPLGVQQVSVSPSPNPHYGQPLTFTATVLVLPNAPAPTGAVTWNFVSGPASACDSSTALTTTSPYQATCAINNPTVATYKVTATVAADNNYNGPVTSPAATATVPPLATSTTVTGAPASPTLGGTITFTATVTGVGPPPLGGSLTWSGVTCSSQSAFTINGTTGTETCDVTAGSASDYTATAQYSGDAIYAPSSRSNSPPITVAQATPEVTVTPSATNGTLTFTATVAGPAGAPTPGGTGTWTISGPASTCGSFTGLMGSGNPQGTATATCTISSAPAGTYTVTYTYPGDPNYTSGSDVLSYTVPSVRVKATLTNGTLVFTGTVAGTSGGPTPGGNGSWTVSGPASSCDSTTALTGTGSPQGTATATCTVSSAAAGTYTVTYSYDGDTNYGPGSSRPFIFQVPNLALASSTGGNQLTFTATLTTATAAPSPNGTVTWSVSGGATSCTGGTQALAGSGTTYTATCTVSNSSGNTYDATASFASDTFYLPAAASVSGVSG